MIASQLELKTYVVTKLSVVADAPVSSVAQGPVNVTTSTRVELGRHATENSIWKVALAISCVPADKGQPAYRVDAELVGIFQVDPGIGEEKGKALVSANAPALLYGAARELILIVTSRGPFSPFSLPSVTFVDQVSSAKVPVVSAR